MPSTYKLRRGRKTMKLKEFMQNIQKIIDEHPEALDYIVISAEFDENIGFLPVEFLPTIGRHNNYTHFDLECKSSEFNAICIN